MLEALIPAAASLFGNLFNSSNQSNFNAQQVQLAQQNMQLQREFAQHGIQWRVADAQAAGIHPLAALGAQTSSFSPVSLGGEAPKVDFSSMGQDLGRAFKAAQSSEVRKEHDEAVARKLQLEKGSLENDILRQELNSKAMRYSRQGGQLGPQIPTGSSAFSSGAIPVAHLSRSPDRAYGGEAVSDKKLEVGKEAVLPFNKSYVFGVPIHHDPSFTLRGQNAEDILGDEHPATKALGTLGTLADVRYSAMKWGPYLDRATGDFVFSGSGDRIKRFRRGRYTAPSYRPWAE